MMRRAVALLALLAAPAAAQPRDTLTIGITQYPSTFHPNIENMAAKSYVLGFARRPLTAYGADWRLACLSCETLPSITRTGRASCPRRPPLGFSSAFLSRAMSCRKRQATTIFSSSR